MNAQRQDDLEDYFHDAIQRILTQGKPLGDWLPYIYKAVYLRISVGREGRVYVPLTEAISPETKPVNLNTQIDVRKAILQLSPRQQEFIYDYFYEELTLDEIASKYQVSTQAASRTIQRGLDGMRKVLAS